MFDPNQMAELAHIKADRYLRAGGGGAHKVYNSSQAYWESRGLKYMSEFERVMTEMREIFRQEHLMAMEEIRGHWWIDVDGTRFGDEIPF